VTARTALVALALAASGAGCAPPSFQAITTPPPFTQAELCDGASSCGGDLTITLTSGVALAFTCTDSGGDPCTGVDATVADPTVATVLPAYLDALSGDGQPQSALVLVGVEVGDTTLAVTTDGGDVSFAVTIVPF
jgi:hypothetical protein